jgi:fructose-bisphosphate aldolase, class II
MKLKNYLKRAQRGKWAIGQFNFSTLEQLRGIFMAAKETGSPVILGTSESECQYMGLEEIVNLVKIYKNKYKVQAFLNLDHGKDIENIKKAIDFGYDAVHFDGSGLNLAENIEITKKLVKFAHKKGVLVEGELGHIGGESAMHGSAIELKEADLTSPDEVEEFAKKTKLDSLAISFGNMHGIYSGEPALKFDILKKVAEKTDAFLVMHGGSGVLAEEIKKAINIGIVKININTEIRSVWRETLLKELNNGGIKPYKVLSEVEDNIKLKVEEKINIFTSLRKI